MVLDIEPDPRPNTHSVSYLYFRYNKIYGAIHGQMAAIGGYGPSRNIYIEGNYVFAGANHGIWSFSEPQAGFRNTNIVFRNNVGEQTFWEDPGWRGVMLLCDTDGATVTGNSQPTVAGKMPGVSINNSTSVSVSQTPSRDFREDTDQRLRLSLILRLARVPDSTGGCPNNASATVASRDGAATEWIDDGSREDISRAACRYHILRLSPSLHRHCARAARLRQVHGLTPATPVVPLLRPCDPAIATMRTRLDVGRHQDPTLHQRCAR
jgi:hypothetical protein